MMSFQALGSRKHNLFYGRFFFGCLLSWHMRLHMFCLQCRLLILQEGVDFVHISSIKMRQVHSCIAICKIFWNVRKHRVLTNSPFLGCTVCLLSIRAQVNTFSRNRGWKTLVTGRHPFSVSLRKRDRALLHINQIDKTLPFGSSLTSTTGRVGFLASHNPPPTTILLIKSDQYRATVVSSHFLTSKYRRMKTTIPPVAAEMVVFMATCAANAPSFLLFMVRVDPGLKPYQPNHRAKVPSLSHWSWEPIFAMGPPL